MSLSDDYYSNFYENITNKGAVGLVSKIVHHSLERYPYSKFTKTKQSRPVNQMIIKFLKLEPGMGSTLNMLNLHLQLICKLTLGLI